MFLRGKSIPTLGKLKSSGARINLNLGNFIDYWIFVDGDYEGKWLKKIQELYSNGVIVDIGSNIGIYPLSLYKVAKKIYAFEPESENYTELKSNLKINSVKNVEAIKAALSSQSQKRVPLHISTKDTGWHSLTLSYGQKMELVDAMALDEFVRRRKIKQIDFIKIDVEGGELNVLMGAKQTLSHLHPAVLIEFNKPRTELAGYKLDDLYRVFKAYHYQGYRLINDQLKQINQIDLKSIYNENILFRQKDML